MFQKNAAAEKKKIDEEEKLALVYETKPTKRKCMKKRKKKQPSVTVPRSEESRNTPGTVTTTNEKVEHRIARLNQFRIRNMHKQKKSR